MICRFSDEQLVVSNDILYEALTAIQKLRQRDGDNYDLSPPEREAVSKVITTGNATKLTKFLLLKS